MMQWVFDFDTNNERRKLITSQSWNIYKTVQNCHKNVCHGQIHKMIFTSPSTKQNTRHSPVKKHSRHYISSQLYFTQSSFISTASVFHIYNLISDTKRNKCWSSTILIRFILMKNTECPLSVLWILVHFMSSYICSFLSSYFFLIQIKYMSNMNCKHCVKQLAELTVFGEFWHLQHHADFQAAWHLQGQSRVARLGETLPEGA